MWYHPVVFFSKTSTVASCDYRELDLRVADDEDPVRPRATTALAVVPERPDVAGRARATTAPRRRKAIASLR